MSNWCDNDILVIGDEYVLDYLENIKMDFETIHPVPKALRNMENNEKACKWMNANWGTHRLYDYMEMSRVSDTLLIGRIRTAWSPSIELLQYTTSVFDVEIILNYYELSNYIGSCKFKDGKMIYSQYVEKLYYTNEDANVGAKVRNKKNKEIRELINKDKELVKNTLISNNCEEYLYLVEHYI